jgi:tetratricopeptide (TPR) repeat protein
MRNFERQADAYVFSLFDSAKPLISTLQKIVTTSGQSADRPNWHHFSIKERIDYLNKCESNQRWIRLHDRKVKKGIGIYLAGMLLIGIFGYQLNFGVIEDKLSQIYITRELQKSPEDPHLYKKLGKLGDHYQRRKDYKKAIAAYEKSIELRWDDSTVLNNLAWLYATCEVEPLRNPERSLKLARLAVELEQSSYILDTLAESYFVNGMNREAIEAGERALKLAKENRSYYKEQLEKFRKASNQ